MKIWTCKIGETDAFNVPAGGDLPMRAAVERAYREITGQDAQFCFSGWDGELRESERAVVQNRLPDPSGDVPKAVAELTMALDNDFSYRISWVANIAMAIHDTKRQDGETEIQWLNRGAEAFLQALCRR